MRPDGSEMKTAAVVRLDTPVDVKYYRNGGILQGNQVAFDIAHGRMRPIVLPLPAAAHASQR